MATGAAGRKQTLEFNADAKKAERSKGAITIGGEIFHARPKTNDVMAEWIDVSPDPSSVRGDDEDPRSKDEAKQVTANVWEQIGVLIGPAAGEDGKDATSEHVDPDSADRANPVFLKRHLALEDAEELMGLLQPRRAEVEEAKNESGQEAG